MKKLPIPFILLIAGQILVYPLFVAALAFDLNVWLFTFGMSAYIFTSIILCTINTLTGKIHIAFPAIATLLGISGLLLIFVIQLIG